MIMYDNYINFTDASALIKKDGIMHRNKEVHKMERKGGKCWQTLWYVNNTGVLSTMREGYGTISQESIFKERQARVRRLGLACSAKAINFRRKYRGRDTIAMLSNS